MFYHQVMTPEQVEQIHESALHILEHTGINFFHAEVIDIFSKAGVKIDGNRVYLPPLLVEGQLKKCPSQFQLYARNPEHNLMFGGNEMVLAPVNCPPFVSDLDQGRRYGSLQDYQNFVKLTGASNNLDMCSNIMIEPSDIPVEQRTASMIYQTVHHTDKCFMGGALDQESAKITMKMLKVLFGNEQELANKPRTIAIPCSLTPLSYDDKMLGVMLEYSAAHQPQIINSLAIAGATAPVTLAGTLAVQNAEILAGITLIQLIHEGTPVVYGGASTNANMRTGALCVGSPEMSIMSSACAQMARYYHIPSRGVGALCDAKIPDAQAAYESMMNLTMAQNCGLNFVLHAAGALETINCVSYEKFVIDDEMCGMVKRIKRGIDINESSLALDTIDKVGPGGHFLDQPHTFKNFRTEFFDPILSNRDPFDKWHQQADNDFLLNANKKWKAILESYQSPELPEGIDKDLKRFVEFTSDRVAH